MSLLEHLGEEVLAWTPRDGWFMIIPRDPHQIIKCHEAHFIMSKHAVVLKHRHGNIDTPDDDPLRKHGIKILSLMGTDWIADAIPQG